MFDLVKFSGNCSQTENGTEAALEPRGEFKAIFKLAIVAIGSANLVLNSVCFSVFLRHRQKEPIMRLLLLFLSATEILASFGMTSVEILRAVTEIARDHVFYASFAVAKATIGYLSVAWVLANSALMARNWCIVLIAATRSEVVLRPFARNTGRCFSRRLVMVNFACIVGIGLVFGLPKASQEEFHFCADTGRIFNRVPLLPFRGYNEFCLASMFFQAVLPVLAVGAASVAMTIGLRRHQQSQQEGLNPSQVQCNKATRTVQVLMLAFVSMELPMFIMVLVGLRLPEESQFWDVFMSYAMEVANLCINLDSTCNFFVYMFTNSAFRDVVLRRRAGDGGGGGGSNRQRMQQLQQQQQQQQQSLLHQRRKNISDIGV